MVDAHRVSAIAFLRHLAETRESIFDPVTHFDLLMVLPSTAKFNRYDGKGR